MDLLDHPLTPSSCSRCDPSSYLSMRPCGVPGEWGVGGASLGLAHRPLGAWPQQRRGCSLSTVEWVGLGAWMGGLAFPP
ncbi:hypothetical protein R6Q59_021333 [Mikania micrantha]